ncbi:Peroxiredoxin [Dyella sp. OK004]|uniref:TlpA family protein disulfide reductase n=1 Tax=Dyella sp. OK004 TaxID=1855292 RepID=UPI0008E98D1F|nr:TlpA disulfide reductase family protein [Dyella sp. OK004]SFS17625.1 Peroxiredoxin [Dyella sp. OK004]
MRRLLALVLALSFMLLATPLWAQSGQQRAEAAGHSLIGTPAPRLKLKTIDGQTIDLASLYGKKAVYLKFWATWCVPCREQMPHLERTFEQAGPDLAVIAIDVGFDDSVEEVRKYQRAVGLGMPIVFDGDGSLGEAFHLRVTPQHVVIGRDGRVLYIGHEANAKLDAALLAARSATPTAIAQAAQPPKDEPHYDVGDSVPGFTAKTLDGKAFPLLDAKRPTVLAFLSPWCESYLATSRPGLAQSCRAMREQVTALSGNSRVRWLGVASGLWASRDDLAKYRDEHHISMPLTLDDSGALFRRFRVTHVPTLLLLDAQGRIVRRVEEAGPSLGDALKTLSVR